MRPALRLRIIAVVVLVLGIAGAELVYWRGTRSPDLLDDASMIGYDKVTTRQVGTLFGQQGIIVQGWSDDLKKPGTQAIILVAAAVLVSGACFYVARLFDNAATVPPGGASSRESLNQ
jgi:hypothetical protein